MENSFSNVETTTREPIPDRCDPAAILMASRSLVDGGESEILLKEWRRLFSRINEPHFQVGVVGEFSRGKSTLINRLLEAEVLPVGSIPTTALATRVSYSPELSLVGIHGDGSKAQLDRLPEIHEGQRGEANAAQLARIDIGVPNSWLQELGIQLLDTPGAGDLAPEVLEQVIDAICVSDAAVVVLDARMAVSLTERAFVEQHVLGRRVPHILAVLAHLDEVQPEHREKVLRHVRDRVAALHPRIVFASAHGESVSPAEAGIEIAGPEAIREALSLWASEPEHRERLRRQLGVNLRWFLALVENDLNLRRRTSAMAGEEKRQELDAEKARFSHARLGWEDLRLALLERCEATLAFTDQRLRAAEKDLLETLKLEAKLAPEPATWWQQQLPIRLRQEFGNLATALSEPLTERILEDFAWLYREIDERFGRRLAKSFEPESLEGWLKDSADLKVGAPMRDLRTLRLVMRIGAGAATAVGLWLYGPLGVAASIGSGLLGEYLIQVQADEQRKSYYAALDSILPRSLHRGAEAVRGRIQAEYESLFRESQREEEMWSAACREALESKCEPADAAGRERLAAKLQLLADLKGQLKTEFEEE